MKLFKKNDKVKTLVMTKEKFESIKDKLGKVILQVMVVGGLVFVIFVSALGVGKSCTKNLEQPSILYMDNITCIDNELVYQNLSFVDEEIAVNFGTKIQELFGKVRNIKTSHRTSELDEIEETIKSAAEFILDLKTVREAAEFK